MKLENNKKPPVNSPAWGTSSEQNEEGMIKAKDPNRLYKLWKYIMPTAKKITYHVDTDQLEIETETYSYLEARNGSQEEKILGSYMEASEKPPATEMTDADYARYRTNELAANQGTEGRQRFTNSFVEKDRVNRPEDKVIDDKTLSSKIEEKLGKGDSKLGKGGYFSTGDIPLEKDVVSYTIQVFSENNKRVGVNFQSPRLQYNLPILADFSVIQDTVEPSKEVAKRIIDKQIKENKIPKEEGEKLKGKIDESKKTSEVRKAISGNVKVKYVDTNGNILTLNNKVDTQSESVLGEKAEDGTYFDKKDQVVGTDYDVTAKKLDTITTTDGKRYRVRRSVNDGLADGSAEAIGNVSTGERTVTYVYEESTTSSVTTNHYKEGTTEKLADSVIQPDLTKGTEYTTKAVTIPEKIEREEQEDRFITRKTTYTLVKTPDNANGTVNNSDITVDYYYRENIEETVVAKEETSTESKKVTRTIKYVDKVTNAEIHTPETQEVTLTREKTVNKVTGNVTYTEWSTGTWEEVVSPEIANYGKPDLPKVSNEEVTADSKDTTILVRYDRLSTPDKPIPEKPEIPSPQEPGTPGEPTPDKPNPQPNPEHPSAPTPNPELPNQETPIPEPTPEPDTPRPETPVSPDPEVPTYETGKREELPNTGTEANAGLAGAGLLTLLAGLGLGFFKKKEDESE